MKFKLIPKITIVVSMLYLIEAASCKKFVDIPTTPTLIQVDRLFETEGGILSAVNGVYAQLRALNPSYANGTFSIYGGLSSDELVTQATTSEYDAFYTNSILATSSIVNAQIWTAAYRIVYRTNTIIENIEKSTALTVDKKNMYLGEMYCIRALSYFYLVNTFGDVPLIVSTNYLENGQKSRTNKSEVYTQMIEDLLKSTNYLNEKYPSSSKSRINKFAACALLARVYLYVGDWEKSELYSSMVLSSEQYALEDNLDRVFKFNSTETIWQIAPINEAANSVEGSVFIPFSNSIVPNIFISPNLMNAFEENDQRKLNWTGSNSLPGGMYYYPLKYKNRVPAPVDEYTVVFRLAEQYLIRAEARMKLDNIDGSLADLNKVRSRSGLSAVLISDTGILSSAILKERQVELFAEWGHRWFDLKRLNLIDEVLASVKGSNWQSTDQLFPIPFNEIQINSALTQNPGY